jgi:hypothetical protein
LIGNQVINKFNGLGIPGNHPNGCVLISERILKFTSPKFLHSNQLIERFIHQCIYCHSTAEKTCDTEWNNPGKNE